jgi:hypothetical protein
MDISFTYAFINNTYTLPFLSASSQFLLLHVIFVIDCTATTPSMELLSLIISMDIGGHVLLVSFYVPLSHSFFPSPRLLFNFRIRLWISFGVLLVDHNNVLLVNRY